MTTVSKACTQCANRTYDALLAQLGDEDAEDRMTVLLAQEARRDEALPEAVSTGLLTGISRLAAIRSWRGLPVDALAQASGIETTAMHRLEAGKETATPEQRASLARALSVPETWFS
jgi:hypothetical protein